MLPWKKMYPFQQFLLLHILQDLFDVVFQKKVYSQLKKGIDDLRKFHKIAEINSDGAYYQPRSGDNLSIKAGLNAKVKIKNNF